MIHCSTIAVLYNQQSWYTQPMKAKTKKSQKESVIPHASKYWTTELEDSSYRIELQRQLNYISVHVSDDELKKFFDKYVDENSLNKKLKTIDISKVMTTSKLCWMLYHNMILNEYHRELINTNFKKHDNLIITTEKKSDEDKVVNIKKTRVSSLKGKLSDKIDYTLLNTLDLVLDHYDYGLNVNNLIHPLINRVTLEDCLEVFTGYQNEIATSLIDTELKEYYCFGSKVDFNNRLKFIQTVIRILNQHIVQKKKFEITIDKLPFTRTQVKERKKKKSSIIKITGKKIEAFNYGKSYQFGSLSIVSEPSHKILKASAVLLFNSKYNTVVLLQANTNELLDIKGTTIQNINMEESIGKRVRKPIETVQTIMHNAETLTVSIVKKIMDKLTTKPILNISGRSNEDIYILKTFTGTIL